MCGAAAGVPAPAPGARLGKVPVVLLRRIDPSAYLRSGTGGERHAAEPRPGKAGNDAAPLGPERPLGAGADPARSGSGRVWRAGKDQETFERLYYVGALLGKGGFGSVYSGVRLSDNSPVSGRAGGGAGRWRGEGQLSPTLPLACRWRSNECLGSASPRGASG